MVAHSVGGPAEVQAVRGDVRARLGTLARGQDGLHVRRVQFPLPHQQQGADQATHHVPQETLAVNVNFPDQGAGLHVQQAQFTLNLGYAVANAPAMPTWKKGDPFGSVKR